jgi:hypothetical protein
MRSYKNYRNRRNRRNIRIEFLKNVSRNGLTTLSANANARRRKLYNRTGTAMYTP